MTAVEITNEAADALAKAGAGRRHMRPGKPGYVLIEMADDVLERLAQVQFPDESISDAIIRLVDFMLRRGRMS